jgi:hypothetical protein
MKIIVTLTDSVQMTEDNWRLKRISNIFDSQSTIDEIMVWANRHNEKVDFSKLDFTEVIS